MSLTVNPSFPPKLAVADNITNDEIQKVIDLADAGNEEAEDVVFELFFAQPESQAALYLLLSKLRAFIEAPDKATTVNFTAGSAEPK